MSLLIEKTCTTCNIAFMVVPAREETAKFCSKKCIRKTDEQRQAISHSLTGRPKSEEWKKDASEKKMGERNPMWKGDDVGISALHLWVTDHFPKPEFCMDCGKVPPLDLANISQEYKRDLSDWEWLCRQCHMLKDGRMNNLKRGK